MLEALLIFLSQFMTIYLLGLQSLMVRDHIYIGAFIGSLLIGVCQFYIYNVTQNIEIGSTFWYLFIFAGPFGITSSMWSHPRISKYIFRRNKYNV